MRGIDAMSNVTEYNRIRRIVFSHLHQDPISGLATVREWIDHYKNCGSLDDRGRKGLLAEVAFYEQYGRDLQLTVAADVGDHADFVGCYNGSMVRIDVTTNIGVKKVEEYAPFMNQGIMYKIALMSDCGCEIIDARLLSLRRCPVCSGYLVPFILMGTERYTRTGMATGEFRQMQCYCCPLCGLLEKSEGIFTNTMMLPVNAVFSELNGLGWSKREVQLELNNYTNYVFKYFRDVSDPKNLAIAVQSDLNTDWKHGDSIPAVQFLCCDKLLGSPLSPVACHASFFDDIVD